jgi:hypothetical protein
MIGRRFPPAFVFFPFRTRGFAAFRALAFFMDPVYAGQWERCSFVFIVPAPARPQNDSNESVALEPGLIGLSSFKGPAASKP